MPFKRTTAAKRPGSTSPKYKERQASAKSVFRPSESDNGCVLAACSRASRTVLRGIPISVSGFQLSGNLVNSRRRFCSFCCSVVGRMNWSGDWMPDSLPCAIKGCRARPSSAVFFNRASSLCASATKYLPPKSVPLNWPICCTSVNIAVGILTH